jgi:uncharacterized protein YcfJ
MMISITYLIVGIVIGFLVKHEIDMKKHRKILEKKLQNIDCISIVDSYDDTLNIIRELNKNLIIIQKRQVRDAKMKATI